jgi:hypothetical protein
MAGGDTGVSGPHHRGHHLSWLEFLADLRVIGWPLRHFLIVWLVAYPAMNGFAEPRDAACLRVGQTAVHHSPGQQVEVVLRHTSLPRVLGRPFGVNISLAIVHHRHHRGRCQYLLGLLRRLWPTPRFALG